VGKRRSALTIPLPRKRAYRLPYNLLGILNVAGEIVKDLRNGDGVVIGMPAIVVRNHGEDGVADFRFPGEFGFLQRGHPDDIHAP